VARPVRTSLLMMSPPWLIRGRDLGK